MEGENITYYLQAAKILTYASLSFFIAMWWAPYLIQLLNWLKFWKKNSRVLAASGEELVVTKKFYEENERDIKTPRGGGILVWVTTLGFALVFWFVLKIFPGNGLAVFLNFVSRQETFIPLGTLFFGSMLGLIDDALVTMESNGNYHAGGLHLNQRFGSVVIFSFLIALWFHFQIELHSLSFFGWQFNLDLITLPGGISGGWLIIPITIVILVATWGTGIIDGFDGLFGGVIIPVLLCFAGLAFARGQYSIATMLMVLAGTTMAFLWYNIPPAKFYIGDTGTVGTLLTLGVVAILIDFIYILPIAGLMLFISGFSVFAQLFSKKFFKRKILLAAPIHHHFEAKGLSKSQITMRYWLISIMTSSLGLAIGLLFQ